ncbi:MAG: hypothetical protein DRJ40_11370 [Thermoprotei archaeon]|nr:MAG: hypothetical protein DRJ40_11370 [Thermoprotei archaeon]
MGLTAVHVKVKNPWTGAFREIELIVDTGSLLTWIRGEVLDQLGIQRRRRRKIKTISGQVIERWTGLATIEYEGHEADVEVVFAEESDAQVLGVIALENLGYRVNPVTGKLEYIGYIAY